MVFVILEKTVYFCVGGAKVYSLGRISDTFGERFINIIAELFTPCLTEY